LASWQCQRVKGAILDFLRREDPLNRHQRKEVKDGAASEVSVVCIDKITYRVAGPPNDLPTEIEARRWLSFLTPRERRVIVGMFWLQETDAEIAEVVGVSCGRVRGIRAEAVQRIRSRIRWSGKAAA
jgi:RNA polymerase sigma factor (sigma-70 family)